MSYHSYEHVPTHIRARKPRRLNVFNPVHGASALGGGLEGGDFWGSLKKAYDLGKKGVNLALEHKNEIAKAIDIGKKGYDVIQGLRGKKAGSMLGGGDEYSMMLPLHRLGLPYDPVAGAASLGGRYPSVRVKAPKKKATEKQLMALAKARQARALKRGKPAAYESYRIPDYADEVSRLAGIDTRGASALGGSWLVNLVKKSEDPKHKAERQNNFMENYTKKRNEMIAASKLGGAMLGGAMLGGATLGGATLGGATLGGKYRGKAKKETPVHHTPKFYAKKMAEAEALMSVGKKVPKRIAKYL